MNKGKSRLLVILMSVVLSCLSSAQEQLDKGNNGQFSGNFRLGYITSKADGSDSETSSAFGGHIGYKSASWYGLSASGTLFVTQELLNNEQPSFFGSDGESYAILGEAFIQGNFGQTEMKAGRFEFNSPFADADDIRMVPNTFLGALIKNTDIAETTLYAVYLNQWSGVDSDIPQEFTDLNGDDGLYVAGAVYDGIDNLGLQGWFYYGDNFANLSYVEAIYERGNLVLGAQFASQTDNSLDNSAPDGDAYGVMASYAIDNFIVSTAYNEVSGTVTNGFGGGPFFTSASDYTIGDQLDQNALALGVDYSGIDKLTLSVLHVDFADGGDETDLIAMYDFSDTMNIEAVYHHQYEDGKIFLVRFNIGL